MIRWTRSARIVPGKMLQAMQWAKEIAEYVSNKYKTQVSVYMDSFGEFGTIRWYCDYADLAALEKLGNQLATDQEYWEKLKKAVDLLTPGSAFDTVMRAI